jgi:phosphoglycerate kinase
MTSVGEMRYGSPAMAATPFEELDVDNRRVLVRVDFNVPLEDGVITDDTRIRAALPTIASLRERGARIILASHLGRPKGQHKAELSMEPVGARLAELLECEVRLPDEVIGDGATKVVNDLPSSGVVLLENLRFEPGEKKNDPDFATALASMADAYVNDAFGVSHRAHASVVGVAQRVRHKSQGLLVSRECAALGRLIDKPARPFVAIVGGAKVSDKLGVLVSLIERLAANDTVIIGGAMANTFLAARGHDLAASLVEPELVSDCRRLFASAAARDIGLLTPVDLRLGRSLEDAAAQDYRVDVEVGALPEGTMALDIGPATSRRYAAEIGRAGTVFWNGPMGVFENAAFAQGTLAVAKAVAECEGFCVVGGGDSVAAVNQSGVADSIDHVSTGGGASLTFIESGGRLPGLDALSVEV